MNCNHQRKIWKKFIEYLWKKWMICSCKLIAKKPFLALIIKAKASILILPKFEPKMCFLASWWYWISCWTTTNKFARLWFCENIHHSSILKLAIKKAIQKSTNWNLSSKLVEDDSNNKKNSLLGLCLHTKRAHYWHLSIFTALLFSILICRRTQLWHASLHHGITWCQICRINNFSLFRIPHHALAGSSKVLRAPARQGGTQRASQTKIYILETGE